jgi:hypothetical protein
MDGEKITVNPDAPEGEKTTVHPDAYRHGPPGAIVIVRNDFEDVVVGGIDTLEACAAANSKSIQAFIVKEMTAADVLTNYELVVKWLVDQNCRPVDGSTQHG